jgi:hypothetical protein
MARDCPHWRPPISIELRAVTPETLHSLLHDLFAANTYWS